MPLTAMNQPNNQTENQTMPHTDHTPHNPAHTPCGGKTGDPARCDAPAFPQNACHDRTLGILLALLIVLAASVPRLSAYAPPAAGLLIAGLTIFCLRRRPALPRLATFWIAVFLSLAALSILWAIDPAMTQERTFKILPVLLPGLLLIGAASAAGRTCPPYHPADQTPPGGTTPTTACPAKQSTTKTGATTESATAPPSVTPGTQNPDAPRSFIPACFCPGGFLARRFAGDAFPRIPAYAALSLIPLAWLVAALALTVEMWSGMPLYRLIHDIPAERRLRLDFLNRQVVSVLLTAPPVIALTLNGAVPRGIKPLWLASAALIILTLILLRTSSQSAQLAALVMIVFCAAFPYRHKIAWRGLAALLTAGILSAPWLAQAMFRHLPSILTHIPIIGHPKAYAANRLEIWDYVSRYALQKPLHGFGIEATRTITDFDSAALYQAGTSILHPHNLALQLWMEFGVIGALTGTAFLLHLLWQSAILPRRAARMALPLIMGGLSISAMTYGLWQGWWLGLLILTGALAVLAIRTTPNTAQHPRA